MLHIIYLLYILAGVCKGSGNVSKCNPTGEFSLESIKMIFSPVHQSSPPIQSSDWRLPKRKYLDGHGTHKLTENDKVLILG